MTANLFEDYVRDKAAIVGVGYSRISRNSGQTVEALALTACKEAILDAGLTRADIDGVITYHLGDSVSSLRVAEGLGLREIRWFNDLYHGGNGAVGAIAEAAMVVACGIAKAVVVYRALNGRSGYRFGQHGVEMEARGPSQFTLPYGYASPPHWFALWCSRYMHEYKVQPEHLGAIAITCRKHACLNERAIMRTPLSMEQYLNSRYIAWPLRLFDCCVEVDGACALVVTSSDRARDLRRPPVYIRGFVYRAGSRPNWEQWPDMSVQYGSLVAQDLWRRTGFAPSEIDFAQLYDCFTITVLSAIEDLGFCKKGEAGAFVEGGERISIGGELPINTHGGLLSEGYLHGLSHSCEAVMQLRGEAGARQVEAAEVGVVTAGGGPLGGAIIYHR